MGRKASLGRRLLMGAAVFIALALVVSAVVIGFVLHRFVQGQVDQRLDTQVVFLRSMLRSAADGTLSLAGNADGPPFDRPGRGWYWQVSGPANVLKSRALASAVLDVAMPSRPPPPPPRLPDRDGPPSPGDRPRPADGTGPEGEPLHYRLQPVAIGGVPATIVVSAPREAVTRPLQEAMTTLALSLLALGVALVLAMVLQVRLGLRPLEQLRRAIGAVRAGQAARVPADQPAEVRPLVAELNALLEQNEATLDRARGHVANLAHGLKTPLATLAVALSARPGNSELSALVDTMDRRIRHHLGRARTAALGGPVRARTPVAERIAALGSVLGKVHAERRIALSLEVPADLAVACEQQDFDEIVGNLLENAFKWASDGVTVSGRAAEHGRASIAIDDDGPGVPAAQLGQILQPGQRLDESAPGFGFGLSITRELVELYGGTLDLGPSLRGGLRATLHLPLVPAA